eukprot:TRINITY_DN1399_c1_g1_i1.p3 TRINITY_DN1399_c1_g1~~TRINITY_DN1399_c1_g1_i1.p3  ORF type:complete len:108 (-),score=29.36 TRINITY_DN1399_c1_g1_i1:306-629(-)
MLKRGSWPRKKRSQSGAKERSELVRKRNAILGLEVDEDDEEEEEDKRVESETDASAARRKSARSSNSSGRDIGLVFGGRIRGASKNISGIEKKRANDKTNGVEENMF